MARFWFMHRAAERLKMLGYELAHSLSHRLPAGCTYTIQKLIVSLKAA